LIAPLHYLSSKWTHFSMCFAFGDPRGYKTRMPTNRCNSTLAQPKLTNGETTTETKTTQNPRLFQAFKFFFSLTFHIRFYSCIWLALASLSLSHSLSQFFSFLFPCALVRPDRMFVYADLKNIFNDTRIFVKAFFSVLFTIIRAMGIKMFLLWVEWVR